MDIDFLKYNGSCTTCTEHMPSLCAGLRKDNTSRVPACMSTPENEFR